MSILYKDGNYLRHADQWLLIKGLEREVRTALPHRADGAPVPQAVGGRGVDQEDAAVPSVN